MLKKFIQHLCYSNVWIAVGASTLGLLYFYLKSLSPNWLFISFLFCSTALTYTYQRYQKMLDNERLKGSRMEWMKRHLLFVKTALMVSLIGTLILCFSFNLKTIAVLMLFAVLSFFYTFKFKHIHGKKINLRDIPGLKIILIGIVWAGSTVLIIDFEYHHVNFKSFLSFIGMCFFVIGITIPFDIRDLHVDESSKNTIPQLIGYQLAILIAVLLILLSAFFINLGTGFDFWTLLASAGLVSFIILPSSPKKSELFYSFIVDGVLIIFPLLIYLLNNL